MVVLNIYVVEGGKVRGRRGSSGSLMTDDRLKSTEMNKCFDYYSVLWGRLGPEKHLNRQRGFDKADRLLCCPLWIVSNMYCRQLQLAESCFHIVSYLALSITDQTGQIGR